MTDLAQDGMLDGVETCWRIQSSSAFCAGTVRRGDMSFRHWRSTMWW
jgi:hypothetical protein